MASIALQLCVCFLSGDIFIYDVDTEPWTLLNAIHNHSKKDDAVVQMAWSLDSTKLITQYQQVICTKHNTISLSNLGGIIIIFLNVLIYSIDLVIVSL